MSKRGNPFPNSIVPVIRKVKPQRIVWNPKPPAPEKPDWWRSALTGLRLEHRECSMWGAWDEACDITCKGK
jgi:hypothetical protein